MTTYSSPGVYTKEVDLSQYTSHTSTCVVGMVGGARRGPVGIPTLVSSQKELLELFGNPTPYEYGIYSALYALTQVSSLYYTRVVRSGTYASAGVAGVDKLLFKGVSPGVDFNGYKILQSAQASSGGTFSITVQDEKGIEKETYKNLVLTVSDPNYVATVINGVSKYITVTVQETGTVTEKTFTLGATEDTKGTGSGTYSRAGKEGTDKITFRSLYFDSDLNGAKLVISNPDVFNYFDITITNADGSPLESWTSLSIDPSSRRYVETVINNGSERIVCTVDSTVEKPIEETTLVFSGGDDGIDGLSDKDIIGETTGGGLYSFSNPETISIDVLCCPGWNSPAIEKAGIELCENRADCIFILDAPFGMKPQEVISWSNGIGSTDGYKLNSSYCAVYWPWLKVSDDFTGKDIWLPPTGFVSAQYAYNDEQAYPWKAPAGLNRGRITTAVGVEMSATQSQRDALYGGRNCINPIVNFISDGIVIWGNKTTQRDSTALDRINVRRMMCYLKRTIAQKTRYFVFEQNIDATWERWETVVKPILNNVKSSEGLYDYKISLEATEEDFENNRMPISIYVKPVKAAEYIPITFTIMPYSATL